MKERLINFKTAKLADKKGSGKIHFISHDNFSFIRGEKEYKRPSQSLLQKWLRDEFNIIVEAISHYDSTQLPLSKTNIVKPIGWFAWNYYDNNFSPEQAPKFSTYEKALEFGLQEGLKLIQTKEN